MGKWWWRLRFAHEQLRLQRRPHGRLSLPVRPCHALHCKMGASQANWLQLAETDRSVRAVARQSAGLAYRHTADVDCKRDGTQTSTGDRLTSPLPMSVVTPVAC